MKGWKSVDECPPAWESVLGVIEIPGGKGEVYFAIIFYALGDWSFQQRVNTDMLILEECNPIAWRYLPKFNREKIGGENGN